MELTPVIIAFKCRISFPFIISDVPAVKFSTFTVDTFEDAPVPEKVIR
jgi:hypothetical protein